MRFASLAFVVACLLGGTSGCRTCGDRPRLIDRLFHNDRDDCPSRSSRDGASAVKPCNDFAIRAGDPAGASMVPNGYGPLHTTPVSSSMPLYSMVPFTGYPSAAVPSSGVAPRENELPMPGGGQRLPPLDLPLTPFAPPSPANPNTATPGNPGRFAGDSRK